MDGALGQNNPVFALWSQAEDVWGKEHLKKHIKCLVSIGTGVPALRPFPNNIFLMGKTLTSIATETEVTADKFRGFQSDLDHSGRYFRFNVTNGLEQVGLEEWTKLNHIAAVTKLYLGKDEVVRQIMACSNKLEKGK